MDSGLASGVFELTSHYIDKQECNRFQGWEEFLGSLPRVVSLNARNNRCWAFLRIPFGESRLVRWRIADRKSASSTVSVGWQINCGCSNGMSARKKSYS